MTVERLRPSYTFTQDRLTELQAVVPEAFADGKIDWDVLKEALGTYLEDEGPEAEHFGLFWPGKREARRLATIPSKGTLKPAPGEEMNEDATGNIFIEGDNLEVLKLLQKSYTGRIKMIYIDPPYNTGNDFVYKDDFREPLEDYLRKTGQADEEGKMLTTNTKADGRFHSNWLNMMYPRLKLARNLLRGDGLICISIDDFERDNLRKVCDEIFGEENFVESIIWKKRYGGGAKEKYLVSVHEYILVYARDITQLGELYVPQSKEAIDRYYTSKDKHYETRGPYRTHPLEATKSMGDRPNLVFPIPGPDGSQIMPRRQWLWSKERVSAALKSDEIEFLKDRDGKWTVHTKQYLKDANGEMRQAKAFSIIDNVFSQHGTNELISLFGDARIFPFPKPTGLLRPILEFGADDPEAIVLDFFAGSGTTAHALMALNNTDQGHRRFILVQLPELLDPNDNAIAAAYCDKLGKPRNIAELTKQRLRLAGQKIRADSPMFFGDTGFRVFKLNHSNFKSWQDYQGEDVQELETLFDGIETPLVEGWSEAGLLTEILLMQGFPLDSTITREDEFKQNNIQMVDSAAYTHRLFVCFDARIDNDTIAQLQLRTEDVFICLDSALTDQSKMRLADACNLYII